MKPFFTAFAILLSIWLLPACSNDDNADTPTTPPVDTAIPVTGVTVAPTNLTLAIGDSRLLTATVQPENADDKTVAWSSDKPSVAAVDSSTGEVVALAEGTAVITATTRDGGKTASCTVTVDPGYSFEFLPVLTNKDLEDVFFVNGSIGFAVGAYGTVLKSEDGGNSWTLIDDLPKYGSFEAIFFTDSQNGYITGYQSLLRTSDGGKTWTEIPTNYFYLHTLFFLDQQTGFLGGYKSDGSILKTTDGGKTWSAKPVEHTLAKNGYDIYSIDFIDTNHGFAVGHGYDDKSDPQGVVLKTTDGGETWREQAFGNIKAELVSVCFPDSRTGYILGSNLFLNGKEKAVVLKTTDGGASWKTIYLDTHQNLEQITFLDTQTGYICGDWANIWKTTDGGEIWKPLEIKDASWINSFWFFGEDNGVCVGYGGKMFRMRKS